MRLWFKRKCLCKYSDSTFELIEEYRHGPWSSEVWHESGWPRIGITRHVEGKWKCSRCQAVKVFDRRYIFDSRWGIAGLLEYPIEL